jgi:hypothetical protein
VTVTVTDAKMIAKSVSFSGATGVIVTNPGARGSTAGKAVSYPNTAAGGTTPYAWSATGLSINSSTGTSSGTPTTTITYSTTVTAKGAAAVTGMVGFTWRPEPPRQ